MADTHDLEKEIRDVIELTQPDAFDPDTPIYARLTKWACELGDAIHAVSLKVEAGELDAFRKPLTDAALRVWDEKIVPMDIPTLPEFAERYVESCIRPLIPAAIDEVVARAKHRLDLAA